jgi:hypothetical protein
MSDHWEMFACRMGERVAFISYDHGAGEELAALPFPYFAGFKVALREADARGLPTGEEFAQLNAIEDLLDARIRGERGLRVGRITTDGHRYFHFYTALDEAACAALARLAAQLHGHVVHLSFEPDPARVRYWDELYPTDDDWQVVQDMRLEQALRDEGDTLRTPRAIVHWAYFPSASARAAFLADVRDGFDDVQLDETAQASDDHFGVRLTHTGRPDYESMNATTLRLCRAARAAGGHYDGWETPVCRD